jgi:lipid II:glycine glycyltransferase (peptidoglycan interpeptide bridge formation enzyme)
VTIAAAGLLVEADLMPGHGSGCDRESWDGSLHTLGGHLLQSWRWGEFKSAHGWDAARVLVGDDYPRAMAQVLFRKAGPVSIGYIPRGPAFAAGDSEAVRELFSRIDRLCQERRALYVVIEPDRALPFRGSYKKEGFVRGPEHIQPSRTVKVPLLDDERLLGQMHQKTRYSVRLAQRRGVIVERSAIGPEAIHEFYALLADTSQRNEFAIHDERYYGDFLRVFDDDAILLFARVDDVRAAGLIAAKFGNEAIYMYGGSSTIHRAHGAAFFLQFEAMRWARDLGATRYDLWGIPRTDPPSTGEDGDRVAGTRGDDWRGLHKFKIGFGGEVVTYPSTLERRYHPLLAYLARRFVIPRG